MKQMADQKRRDIMFQIGDWVLFKLHQYLQQTVFKWVHQKLAARYYGPYQIVDKMGQVAYQLQLPAEARIHPVFHVSLLKHYQTKKDIVEPRSVDIPPITDDDKLILESQTILDCCWHKQGQHLVVESLVQWKYLPVEDATWEPITQLQELFPTLNLEDKVPLNGGSIDRPRRSERGLKPNPKYLRMS
jgi:hypothetical protein